MPRPSFISQEDLTRVAHGLAAGHGQAKLAKDFGWDKNAMRRCADRLHEEVVREAERGWGTARENALEWLRMRGLCTPDELDAALTMARIKAQQDLEATLKSVEHDRIRRDFKNAERRYRLHLRDDPDNTVVLVKLAICILEMGGDTRLDEVFALLDAALVMAPEYAWGHYGKAFALKYAKRVKEGLAALEKAHLLAPDEELITAHLGGWRMSYGFDIHSHDSSVALLNGVMDTLVRKYAGKSANKYYCSVVTETIFKILWDMVAPPDEAMAVARIAEQQGWGTPYVLETARTYVKPPPVRKLFQAMARARSNERQGHWPANTVGYDIKLYVWTMDADEAQSVALEYLRGTEPSSVEFQLEFFTTTLVVFIHPKHSYAEQIGPPTWILAAKPATPADVEAGAPPGSRPSLPSQVHRSGLRRRQTRRRAGGR